jgi:hypothetical protein
MATILILIGIALLVLLAVLFGPMILLWIFLGIAALIALFIWAVKYSSRIEERLLAWIYTIGKGKTP